MTPEPQKIKALVAEILPYITGVRRHLHRFPELSFEEYESSAYLTRILEEKGIPFTNGWVKTGIVATVVGAHPGPRRAFRAELDALPIQEQNQLTYQSEVPGKMHACGHDVHAAALLGACIIAHQCRSDVAGTLEFIFQPGEEKLPGGASLMLAEKALGNDLPESIIAQHVFPDLPAGHVGICPGKYMASSDELYITITGKGGHEALPHLCIDPIVIAAELITALQQLVARTANPFFFFFLTLGKINSIGGATNIIPEQVAIEGTFRTMDEAWRYEAHRWIENTTKGIADAHGASARVEIKVGYPCLNNDETLTHKVKSAMVAFLGEDKVHDIPKRMTSEDFAYFAQLMPACFYRLGVAYADGRPAHGVHSPYFEVDEKALETAIGLMAWLAVLP